jgi:predicted NodU family carbamoyl transferase
MISIGFSIGHDKGAALINDGNVLVGISEERLSRIKNADQSIPNKVPFESIEYCLSYIGIEYDDVDIFTYNSTLECHSDIESQFMIKYGDISKLHFIPHHLAHAHSTYYSSTFNQSVVVVADAMGNSLKNNSKAWDWFEKNSNWNLVDTSNFDFDWAEGIKNGLSFHFHGKLKVNKHLSVGSMEWEHTNLFMNQNQILGEQVN